MPLAPMPALGVGGPARYFLHAADPETVVTGVAWARERQLPVLVFGGGSNLLIADEGFPGLALRVAVRGMEHRCSDGVAALTAGAGENWNALVTLAISQRWAGVECLAGIPGYVGATPIQNVGAYGQEVCESITQVEAFDLNSGRIVTLTNTECAFGYRESRFKREDRGRFIILKVHFRLEIEGSPTIRYNEVERQLAQSGLLPHPSLSNVRDAVLAIRRRKSMLIDIRDPNTRSAGSFFINPVLTAQQLAELEAFAASRLQQSEPILSYPAPDGQYKVPAAWLIERAGFSRGQVSGPVGISSNHTLALVNRGNATARDILALAREIRDRVFDRFGIYLVPEPTFVGVTL